MVNSLLDNALNVAADAMAAVITHTSIHTAEPDDTGSNESTAPRELITWNPAAGGTVAMAAAQGFTGGTPNGPAEYVGLWGGAGPGGTFYGAKQIPAPGDQTFNGAGEYTLNTLTLPGSAT